MHEPWQYDDQAKYVTTALRGKILAALRAKDLLRLFPKDEGFFVQTSESGDQGWAIFVCNRMNVHGNQLNYHLLCCF
jgi:hypothetical protein